jgi:hypothetical protein
MEDERSKKQMGRTYVMGLGNAYFILESRGEDFSLFIALI